MSCRSAPEFSTLGVGKSRAILDGAGGGSIKILTTHTCAKLLWPVSGPTRYRLVPVQSLHRCAICTYIQRSDVPVNGAVHIVDTTGYHTFFLLFWVHHVIYLLSSSTRANFYLQRLGELGGHRQRRHNIMGGPGLCGRVKASFGLNILSLVYRGGQSRTQAAVSFL